MQMKIIAVGFICSLCVFFAGPLLAGEAFIQDTTQTDTVRQAAPDFEKVNVTVETEWGTSDKHENVDVRLVREGKKVKEVVVIKKFSECSVSLIPGVIVKIIDPETGKVLRRFK